MKEEALRQEVLKFLVRKLGRFPEHQGATQRRFVRRFIDILQEFSPFSDFLPMLKAAIPPKLGIRPTGFGPNGEIVFHTRVIVYATVCHSSTACYSSVHAVS